MSIKEAFDLFISTISSPELQAELFWAKAVFIFFTVAFLLTIIYFIFNSSYLRYRFFIDFQDFFNLEPVGLRKIAGRWKAVRKRIETGSEYEYKLAIMEAEDLFNDVLIEKGFAGDSFEKRVDSVEKIQLPNPDEILEAHKIRNFVAHDPNYKINKEEAGKVLDVFEKGIRGIESF